MRERRHPRLPARLRCWCEGEEVTLYAQMANISEGGLFVKTHVPLPLGSRVRIRLGGAEEDLEVSAEVVWRRAAGEDAPGEDPGMGLRFEPLDAGAAAALREHLGRIARGG